MPRSACVSVCYDQSYSRDDRYWKNCCEKPKKKCYKRCEKKSNDWCDDDCYVSKKACNEYCRKDCCKPKKCDKQVCYGEKKCRVIKQYTQPVTITWTEYSRC